MVTPHKLCFKLCVKKTINIKITVAAKDMTLTVARWHSNTTQLSGAQQQKISDGQRSDG